MDTKVKQIRLSDGNCIIATESFAAECYGTLYEVLGDVPSIAPPPSTEFTHTEILNAFTDDELKAILTAAKTDVEVELFLFKFNRARFIDAEDPSFKAGIAKLKAASLITADPEPKKGKK
jgi:hypothetical protein